MNTKPILTILIATLAWAGDGDKPKSPSLEAQRNYFREVAAYQGLNTDLLQIQHSLDIQKKRAEEAETAMEASCGAGYILDKDQLQHKGEAICILKPSESAKPKK